MDNKLLDMNMSEKQMIDLALQTNLNEFDNLNLLMEILKTTHEQVYAKVAKRGYAIASAAATELLNRRGLTNKEFTQAQNYYELARRFCTYGGQNDFDLYMIACEWMREPSAKFWIPRRKILEGKHHIATELQKFLDDPKMLMLTLSTPPGAGKALANDTPVLTREGWKNHGDLVVGDEVIGLDGEFKKVLAVHPKCQVDRLIEFTNGEKIMCHARHEWLFYEKNNNKLQKKETQEWENYKLDIGVPGKRGHRYLLLLPHKEYVKGNHKELPLDPYTFGAWLGDGITKNPTIANPLCDKAIIEKIVRNGNPISWQTVHKTTGVYYYGFKFRKQLRAMNMCHSKKIYPKYIPDIYLTASIDQRLELLAGLLDTDGTLQGRKYTFSTTNENIRDGFISLISSFGWRGCVKRTEPKISTSGIVGRNPVYTISFTPDCFIPCVVKRKQNHTNATQRRISVKSITKVKPTEGNCITVEGGMYLVGKTLLPTHNSTILKFLLAYMAGKYPRSSNMYITYSDGMVKMMYESVKNILTDTTEYKHNNIFNHMTQPYVSAEYNTISYKRAGDFPTLGFVSLGGSITGRTRANKIMVTDDLVRNAEMARSPERLQKLWDDYRDTITTRQIGENVKQIMLGTIWSLHDPISRMRLEHENDPRYKFIAIPVEDELGHSNFLYDCEDRYTDEKILDIKNSLDTVTYSCLYLQKPMEREGLLFEKESLNYYNGVLPEGETDRKVFACDVAYGGGDSLAMPIAYVYDNMVYIVDVVFNKGDKKVTQPIVAGRINHHMPHSGRFEANNGGDAYAANISDMIEVPVNITWKKAPTTQSKVSRIIQYAPDIKNFYFLDKAHRSEEYQRFFDEFVSFVQTGNNVHDDAADSLAQLAAFLQESYAIKTKVIKRPC